MKRVEAERAVTLGCCQGAWFTQTDDGVVLWHQSRGAAVEVAIEWMNRHRPARVMLVIEDEAEPLFAAA